MARVKTIVPSGWSWEKKLVRGSLLAGSMAARKSVIARLSVARTLTRTSLEILSVFVPPGPVVSLTSWAEIAGRTESRVTSKLIVDVLPATSVARMEKVLRPACKATLLRV